jgi:hypothetical protein
VEKDSKKKLESYQDAVTGAPGDDELDADAAGIDEDDEDSNGHSGLSGIKASVHKV